MRKQRLTIPLAGGIATGSDGKLLPIGKSEDLRNVRPGRVGEVVQRPGVRTLGRGMIGAAGNMPLSWNLGTLRGDLTSFGPVGDHPVGRYSPVSDSWAVDGTGANGILTKRRGPIAATLTQVSGNGLFPDVVYSAGYYWVIYKTTRNGVDYLVETVIDATTGYQVAEQTAGLTALFWGVRVVNGSACFVYGDATRILVDTWPTASVTTGPQNRVLIAKTVVNNGRQFDMYVKDGATISAAYADATNIQCFDYAPTAGAATFWTPKDSAGTSIPSDYSHAWMQDFGGSGKIALISNSVGIGAKVHWDIPTAGATRQAATTYVMDGAAHQGAIAGFTMTSSATGQFTVLYEQGLVGIITPVLVKAATREAGVIATAVYYRSLSLGSKPFVGPDGKYYMGMEFVSPSQPTRFVVKIPETIANFQILTGVVAKTQVNNGYVGMAQGPLCAVANPATNTYVYGNTVQLRLPGNPTTYVPQGVGVDLVKISFKATKDTTTSPPREAIDSLFTPGGSIGQFDGRTYCDAGFHYYPEQPVITPGGGGAKTAGATYYYVLVYSWIDINGRTWPSAPSKQASVAMGANTKNTLACPTERLADRDDIQIQVYAGAANDNITMQLVGIVANDPTADTVTFVDTFADTAYANGQALYTNGAAGNRPLAADCIPGASALTVVNDRAWFISNDNPYEVWPSNKFIPGQGWRFSEQNKLILNDSQGPATAIGALPNGVVVIFKANAYYLVSGDGPNQAGNGGSFSVSTPAIGAGTSNPRSVLETPSGVEFRSSASPRSWYRVNTALQAEYIGSPVERYAAPTIIAAVLVTATGETRYYTTDSDAQEIRDLVHDAISDTWVIDTSGDDLGDVNAACAYNGYAAFSGDGGVAIDNPGSPLDGTTNAYTVYAVTPWIKGSDLDGYATFIRVRGVGEAGAGAPAVTVALQADFDATTNVTSQTASPGTAWDWELKYPAKLSSFRFVVSYLATAVQVKVTALVVEYGVKDGMVPAAYTKRTQ